MGDIVTATVLQATPDFTIVKIRDGVEAELPQYEPEALPQRKRNRTSGRRTLSPQSAH